MTGEFFLDWATIAVSLLDMVLLLWLGLTVLLNAERRNLIFLLAVGALFLGALFFLSHSAILGRGWTGVDRGLRFWWRAGLSPAILLPFAWYLLILWYAGFWNDSHSALHRRQRPWFVLVAILLFLGGVSFMIVANPFLSQPTLVRIRGWLLTTGPSHIPLPALGYLLYLLLCTVLSLDALRRPGPTFRIMGTLARRRAHPWLVATSMALLLVGVLVGWAILSLVPIIRQGHGYLFEEQVVQQLARFDLAISSLIAVAVILLGQAIVSYEIFTGKILPRRGLLRHWRNAVMLAAGYGALIGWGIALHLRPIYSLLLTTLLMVFFYALLSWRSYVERQRYMQHLRPFVASQHLYEQLLERRSFAPHEVDDRSPFRTLCRDVLGTPVAYLLPVGPLAPLVGPLMLHPEAQGVPPALLASLADITAQPVLLQEPCLPLDPAAHGGALWAIPLWSERGMIGLLCLGEKEDGGLYSQEEIELARASGERLIDTLASTEMARRLMRLQRQRMAEGQLLDQRARRVIHDEVLPSLHATMLNLSSSAGEWPDGSPIMVLADIHRQLSNLLREMPSCNVPEIERRGLLAALQENVAEEWEQAFDEVRWEIEPEAEQRSRALSPLTAEVLFYAAREAIRNAARYGRSQDPARPLCLRVGVAWLDGLEVVVEDDGVGVGAAGSDSSGAGQGLALHSTMMAVIGGSLALQSRAGRYTRVVLSLPQENW